MILVTGASGFIGHHLVTALKKRFPATPLRAFDAKPASPALPADVQTAYGLVEESTFLPDVVHGAEVVIHLAAIMQPASQDYEAMRRVNVEGTRNIYSAAVDSGCKLFLHQSSAGVYGAPCRRDPFHEDDIPNPVTPYQRTKWEAEEALREIDARDTTLNILRPAGIYAPGNDLEIALYKKVRHQRWVVELSGGILRQPTHVEDVVQAILAIVEHPAPHGTALNIGGEQAIRLEDLRALVAMMLGVPRRRLVLPVWLASPLAALAEPVLAYRRGRPNPLLRGISRGHLFSSAVDDGRFRQRYPHVPVVELQNGLREYIEWAVADGLL